jgi:hypothetical protein
MPHGAGAQQGDRSGNAHLVNFDLDIVTPGSKRIVRYESFGTGAGRCTLACHAKDHGGSAYPASP